MPESFYKPFSGYINAAAAVLEHEKGGTIQSVAAEVWLREQAASNSVVHSKWKCLPHLCSSKRVHKRRQAF